MVIAFIKLNLIFKNIFICKRLYRFLAINNSTQVTYLVSGASSIQILIYICRVLIHSQSTLLLVRMSDAFDSRMMARVPHARTAAFAEARQSAWDSLQLPELMQKTASFAQNQLTIHVHCLNDIRINIKFKSILYYCLSCLTQWTEVQQHFVSTKVLSDNVIGVHSYDGQTEEQMEIVGQVVGPAGFPHPNSNGLGELPFEASVVRLEHNKNRIRCDFPHLYGFTHNKIHRWQNNSSMESTCRSKWL